jgi:S-phase kinase-associated protein 1
MEEPKQEVDNQDLEEKIEEKVEEPSKPITLVSSDGAKVVVDSKSVSRSKLVKQMLTDFPDEPELKISEVTGTTLKSIAEYLEHYRDIEPKELPKPLPSGKLEMSASDWDCEFIKKHDMNAIIDIINGSEFMQVDPLFLLTCAKIACEMWGLTCEQVREKFNIVQDLTEEEIKEFEGYEI